MSDHYRHVSERHHGVPADIALQAHFSLDRAIRAFDAGLITVAEYQQMWSTSAMLYGLRNTHRPPA